ENSVSSFCVNLVLEPRTVRYEGHNYYYMEPGCAWTQADYTEEDWPRGYALFYGRSRTDPEYASSVTIMQYMRYDEVRPWVETFNTVAEPEPRGADYEEFKEKKYRRLMQRVAERFPRLSQDVAGPHPRLMPGVAEPVPGLMEGVAGRRQAPDGGQN